MKYDISELEKALNYLKKHGNPSSVAIKFDPMERLLISAYDGMIGQGIEIIIYPSESQKMAEVTITTRL